MQGGRARLTVCLVHGGSNETAMTMAESSDDDVLELEAAVICCCVGEVVVKGLKTHFFAGAVGRYVGMLSASSCFRQG